ncbi:hypothetical protein [Streptomyces sp. NBC_00233]|uniref:hypothetical protein n=1 Tax=Streptomyces sp. NBC_00233 TaxID=2975686 RepID=UPI0022538A1A|nr:hypothetical protein [Streptomyces sp. NBC_00233]MCX5229722.1 hypothetical protein [Streptomyces sp. NBC_00233]
MTGPEHYREAERRLAAARADYNTPTASGLLVAEAQVHATLALAAATALSDPTRSAPRAPLPEWNAWKQAAGVAAQEDDR